MPSEALEAAVEQAPALEAELDEASGDGETVTVVPALDVEAARVRPFRGREESRQGRLAHGERGFSNRVASQPCSGHWRERRRKIHGHQGPGR